MEVKELKRLANLPENMSAKAAYNHIIGTCFPGGNEILDICERLHKAQHGRTKKDPMLQELLEKAIKARDSMAETLKNCTEDGVLVRL